MSIAASGGGTLKLQQFTALYICSGWTNIYLAFCFYLQQNIFNQRLSRAGRL
jgi:hypothetical protein